MPIQPKTWTIKAQDGEFWQFRLDNEALYEAMKMDPGAQVTPFDILWLFSAGHREDTGSKATFPDFRRKVLPPLDAMILGMAGEMSEALRTYNDAGNAAAPAAASPPAESAPQTSSGPAGNTSPIEPSTGVHETSGEPAQPAPTP